MANHKRKRQFSPNRCRCKSWKFKLGSKKELVRPSDRRRIQD